MTDTKTKPAVLSKSWGKGPEITIDFQKHISQAGYRIWANTSEEGLKQSFRSLEMTPENEAMVRNILEDLRDEELFRYMIIRSYSIVLILDPAPDAYQSIINKFKNAVPGEIVDDPPFDGVGTFKNGFAGD
ncbi:hypothetical protein C4544_04965 [candidate division WS5 bacterium]|uniref:Uncharacterized protein n=1 Tax=candidate division WS5 bacterium TaxID=2093353 RepID=A0A419DBJ5_9BACT|nr:MAG: hypothetical protein C4544_04965 [candidate division WS5 bacterium]